MDGNIYNGKYNMGLSNYWGSNDPGFLFENVLVPYLKKAGVKKDKDIDFIFSIVREIAGEAYSNGGDNREGEIEESDSWN